MKSQPVEAQVYIVVVLVAALGILLWSFQQPGQVQVQDNQTLLAACFVAAVLLEFFSPSLPHFGSLGAAGGVYIFLILTLGIQVAVLSAFAAVTLRVVLRERGPWMLRVFSPFQKVLSLGVAGMLPRVLEVGSSGVHDTWKLLSAAAGYFLFDALGEGTAVGLTLALDAQRLWFKARYRALALSLAAPLTGGLALFFYQGNAAAALLLFFLALLLQAAMGAVVGKEGTYGLSGALLEDLERLNRELQGSRKQHEELRRQHAQKTLEQGILLDFGRAVGSNLTLDYTFEVILDILKKLFRYQSCIIFFAGAAGGESYLRAKRYHSPYADFCKGLHLRFGETIVGLAAQDQKSYLVDSRKRPDLPLLIEKERAAMTVPLIVEERVKGVLYVGSSEEGAFTDPDLQLLTTIAYQAAIVLVYAESYEYTVHLATTDGLTGLYTHRYFQERLMEEVKRSERYHQPLSLIMADLDNFKDYNDANGHPQGDALLKQISQILRECTRETDVICRYGGDEFAILLIETTKEIALSIAKRIREAIELRLNVASRIKVTASLGVASFPQDASTKTELLGEADRALYEGKNAGRNQVVSASKLKSEQPMQGINPLNPRRPPQKS